METRSHRPSMTAGKNLLGRENMENHHFKWVNKLHITIFHSYASLPEGMGSAMV